MTQVPESDGIRENSFGFLIQTLAQVGDTFALQDTFLLGLFELPDRRPRCSGYSRGQGGRKDEPA